MTSQPDPLWRGPSDPVDETYAEPPVGEQPPTEASGQPTSWEQPPFSRPPASDHVLVGDVIVPGEQPKQPTSAQRWWQFIRTWGIVIAVIGALFTNWWWLLGVAIVLVLVSRTIVDGPRRRRGK